MRNYGYYDIKNTLQKACDRDWENESMYETAQIVANALMNRNKRIADLELLLKNLALYFDKRSKENARRAEKDETKLSTVFMSWEDSKRVNNSSYYFSGKADSYKRAAERIAAEIGLNRCCENGYFGVEHKCKKESPTGTKASWPYGW